MLAGCGGGDAPATRPAPARIEREVRQLFATYTRAVATRDYATACAHLTPGSIARMRSDALKFLNAVPHRCPQVFAYLARAAPQRRQTELTEVSRTARVDRIVMVGRNPVIHWSAMVGGRRVPVTQAVRRVGDELKLVAVRR